MRMANLPQNTPKETVLRMSVRMEDLTYQRFEEQGVSHLTFMMIGEKIDIPQSLEYLSEFLNEVLLDGVNKILIISDRNVEVANGSIMEKKLEQKRSDDDDLFMELKYKLQPAEAPLVFTIKNGSVDTKSFTALEAEAYYDDEFREDVESILSAKYISIIIHACHSGGFIEDLNNANLNRLLIASCDESESSTIFGPLFNEWLNERCIDYPLTPPPNPLDIKIYNADSSIQNEPTVPYNIIKLIDLGYDGKHDNIVISLQEMFINSVRSSYIAEEYFGAQIYYLPEKLTGGNCYAQMYL